MKKWLIFLLAVLITAAASAIDLGNGFSLKGGVKTGILVKNSEFTGNFDRTAVDIEDKPFTLYFASDEDETYNGAGWIDFDFSGSSWGLHLGAWAHGSLENWDASINLGDHYLWATLFDGKFKFIGGQGGGTPIGTGGWLDADWLGYTGLRAFYLNPAWGLSIGINLPDPGKAGIGPLDYLTTIIFGAKYSIDLFSRTLSVALLWDDNPIYDDSNVDRDGGLHREKEALPISAAGNLGFGLGVDKLYWGNGFLAFDGVVASIGEPDKNSTHSGMYKLSPITTTLALKTGYPFLEKFYVELKAKYEIRQGDNADYTGAADWGILTFEPYLRWQVLKPLKIDMSFNIASYFNSYYLAAGGIPGGFAAGQVPRNNLVADYASTYIITVNPVVAYSFLSSTIILGYKGIFSRDHAENKIYLDFRWTF